MVRIDSLRKVAAPSLSLLQTDYKDTEIAKDFSVSSDLMKATGLATSAVLPVRAACGGTCAKTQEASHVYDAPISGPRPAVLRRA